jgi:hypothetical protein
MLRLPVAALLLCSAAAALFAQSAPGQPAAVQGQQAAALAPRDDRDRWNIGFSALEAAGLSPGNSYLAGAIPLLLRDSLARLPWHDLAEPERASRRQAIVAREAAALDRSIAAERSRRDDAFFGDPAARAAALAAAEQGLAVLLERREALAMLDPSIVDVPSRKDLLIVDGTGEGKLFDPPAGSRGVFCDERGLDMLVGGSLAEVQGFLRLDLWAWDAARGRIVFSWREAGTREQLYETLSEAGRGLVEHVLGGPWASLRVNLSPPLASLSVDGDKAAPAGSGELFLVPGTHLLRASAAGHADSVREVTLAPEQSVTLEIALERIPAPRLTLATDPPGVNVYFDSLWIGRSPLELDLPAERGRVLLAREGYNPLAFSLGPAGLPALPLVLEPSTVSRDQLQRRARDAFYGSFGWFLLSLPAPIFCYRYAFDYAGKAQALYIAGRTAEADRAVRTGSALYWTSVGGAVASASLFAWVVSTIVRYIAVSDRAAG